MQTADRTAMAGIVAGLAGAVMTALLEKVLPDTPLWIWQGLFAASALMLVFSLAFLADEHLCRPRFRRTIVGPALLIIISTLGFMAGIAWALKGNVPIFDRSPDTSPPTVILITAIDRLQLNNDGATEVLLWGDKLKGYPSSIEDEARHIPPGYHYYFLNDGLKRAILIEIGQNGQIFKNFEVYLTYQSAEWIAKFRLLIIMSDGVMTVHTQQLGVEKQNFRSS